MTTTVGAVRTETDDLAALERLRAAYAAMCNEIGRVVIDLMRPSSGSCGSR